MSIVVSAHFRRVHKQNCFRTYLVGYHLIRGDRVICATIHSCLYHLRGLRRLQVYSVSLFTDWHNRFIIASCLAFQFQLYRIRPYLIDLKIFPLKLCAVSSLRCFTDRGEMNPWCPQIEYTLEIYVTIPLQMLREDIEDTFVGVTNIGAISNAEFNWFCSFSIL